MIKPENYGKFIADYRKNNRLTQVQISEHLGCSAQYVNNVEKVHNVSLEVLKKFIKAINDVDLKLRNSEIQEQARKILKK